MRRPLTNLRSCHRPPCRANRRAAFTLIEMLVVVAIISLLVSILTPSLSRARQQAKSAVCLTRLSEFMKGLVMYSSDHQYLLPPLQYPVEETENAARHGWAEALYAYLYSDQNFARDQDYPVQRNRGGAYELWVCKEAIPMTDSTGHYRPYEVSWLRGSLERIPARLPLLTDANPLVTDPNDVELSYIPRERIAGLEGEAYIDERHYGGANYAFNDGHAERNVGLKERLAEDWDLDPETENR
jgi:prepilin-type N-terminal cleavage/methylation domain-containing protein/prepilin-type processing-associated H-X9-DG protein